MFKWTNMIGYLNLASIKVIVNIIFKQQSFYNNTEYYDVISMTHRRNMYQIWFYRYWTWHRLSTELWKLTMRYCAKQEWQQSPYLNLLLVSHDLNRTMYKLPVSKQLPTYRKSCGIDFCFGFLSFVFVQSWNTSSNMSDVLWNS